MSNRPLTTLFRWFESPAAPARCRAADAVRGSARRLLRGRLEPPPELRGLAAAAAPAAATPGRVHSGGATAAAAAATALQAVLPPALGGGLRPGFEWYVCRGAFFHTDAHYDGVLFGAWCVQGPPREVAFARLALRVPAGVGDWVVFDPFEPHAVLAPGAAGYRREDYATGAPSVFLGFEIELSAAVRAAFGIGPAPPAGPELSSRTAVNAETGALA